MVRTCASSGSGFLLDSGNTFSESWKMLKVLMLVLLFSFVLVLVFSFVLLLALLW